MDEATFLEARQRWLKDLAGSVSMAGLSDSWIENAVQLKWPYLFDWLGLPAIQFPTDAWALQEIIWRSRPQIIIETGVARGGSIILYASLLALLDLTDAYSRDSVQVASEARKVVGVELALQDANREAILSHPVRRHIRLIDGNSTATRTFNEVKMFVGDASPVMVVLDSNHTHDHVLRELQLYAPLVSPGQYIVVMDTVIDRLPESASEDRPWGPGNSPMTAVNEFLRLNPSFARDELVHKKIQISAAPAGFLIRHDR